MAALAALDQPQDQGVGDIFIGLEIDQVVSGCGGEIQVQKGVSQCLDDALRDASGVARITPSPPLECPCS